MSHHAKPAERKTGGERTNLAVCRHVAFFFCRGVFFFFSVDCVHRAFCNDARGAARAITLSKHHYVAFFFCNFLSCHLDLLSFADTDKRVKRQRFFFFFYFFMELRWPRPPFSGCGDRSSGTPLQAMHLTTHITNKQKIET